MQHNYLCMLWYNQVLINQSSLLHLPLWGVVIGVLVKKNGGVFWLGTEALFVLHSRNITQLAA